MSGLAGAEMRPGRGWCPCFQRIVGLVWQKLVFQGLDPRCDAPGVGLQFRVFSVLDREGAESSGFCAAGAGGETAFRDRMAEDHAIVLCARRIEAFGAD